MKKFVAIAMTAAMAASLVACGSSSSSSSSSATTETKAEATEGAKTVGIAMPTKSLERWNRDGEYLKEQFEAAGYNVELTYSDNSTEQQNNDIANMISDNVDILIVAAIDGETLNQTLADAKDQGIPVISYDRLIMGTDAVSYYVSFDNYTVGVLQGQFVIDTLDLDNTSETYNIEFTAGDPADNNAGYFFNGAHDTLAPYIEKGTLNIPSGKEKFEEVATPAWSTDTAYENFQNTLASYYSDGDTVLDIALCSNDSTALGVAKAIEDDYAKDNTVLVTGQDGDIANLQNIVDGKQTMTVYKNVANEAGATLELAKAMLEGKTIDESLIASFPSDAVLDTESYDNGTGIIPSFLLVPSVITAENLEDLVETGLYKWDADNKYLVSTAE